MPDLPKALLGFALLPLVAACAAPGAPAPRTGQPSVPGAFIAPKVMNDPALSFVIGSRASQLEQTFGPPRLDVLEGDARKLQFAGEQCVLDVFLYPLSPGAEPTATYVDARRASDALDVDRGACAKALRR